MNTKPFHPNHFGEYTLYNGANKVYLHELVGRESEIRVDAMGTHSVVLPVASKPTSIYGGSWKDIRTEVAKLSRDDAKKFALYLKSTESKPLSPVESAE